MARCSPPRARNILVVDDDNVRLRAPYHNINAALAVAEAGDEIQVCPGLYMEQVVLTKPLTLRGMPVGSQKAVIMPPALLASRQSTIGGKFIAAGILVDAPKVVLDSLVVDMSAANVPGCAPAVAGIYVRDASGPLTNLEVSGAHATAPPDCDTGVGLLIEGGQIGDNFGQPLLGKAVVSLSNSTFTNNQKGGVVVLGNRAIVKIRDSQVLGDGAAALEVQNGIELTGGSRRVSRTCRCVTSDERGGQDRHRPAALRGAQGQGAPRHDHGRADGHLRRR